MVGTSPTMTMKRRPTPHLDPLPQGERGKVAPVRSVKPGHDVLRSRLQAHEPRRQRAAQILLEADELRRDQVL